LIYYFFDGKKVTKKANAKKAFLLVFSTKISAKPSLQADVFCVAKKLLPSLCSVGRLSATYAGFGVARRKFS